ncbi:hypothetical protein E2C01_003335 [Portunus trituberculatus]|uniref:Uncharacterized protein n=1 Tax=Portunus trituberculatus TaxID=210409 RepID=A0A5B7CNF7_PORTR|nr:hypothetical protein [Portunus trituberculatus]
MVRPPRRYVFNEGRNATPNLGCRRTHDAAIKQSEGPGSLPNATFRQLLSLRKEAEAARPVEAAILYVPTATFLSPHVAALICQ